MSLEIEGLDSSSFPRSIYMSILDDNSLITLEGPTKDWSAYLTPKGQRPSFGLFWSLDSPF